MDIGPTNEKLQAQVADLRRQLADAEQRAAGGGHETADAAAPADLPSIGQVCRDDRLGDGYVLVVDVDDDLVTVAQLAQVHQVGRHAFEPDQAG